jgi:hypothetical protein
MTTMTALTTVNLSDTLFWSWQFRRRSTRSGNDSFDSDSVLGNLTTIIDPDRLVGPRSQKANTRIFLNRDTLLELAYGRKETKAHKALRMNPKPRRPPWNHVPHMMVHALKSFRRPYLYGSMRTVNHAIIHGPLAKGRNNGNIAIVIAVTAMVTVMVTVTLTLDTITITCIRDSDSLVVRLVNVNGCHVDNIGPEHGDACIIWLLFMFLFHKIPNSLLTVPHFDDIDHGGVGIVLGSHRKVQGVLEPSGPVT